MYSLTDFAIKTAENGSFEDDTGSDDSNDIDAVEEDEDTVKDVLQELHKILPKVVYKAGTLQTPFRRPENYM